MRLNEPPPSGVHFAGWRAETVPEFAVGTGIHHPNGDLKKWSQGTTQGYEYLDDGTGASFVRMRWNQGATEVGSSGAGLFTYYGAGGYYELRGGLFGGDSSCSARAELDYFSRLDQALPYLRQYLTPNAASPRGVVPVVEFYNQDARPLLHLDQPGRDQQPGHRRAARLGAHRAHASSPMRIRRRRRPERRPCAASTCGPSSATRTSIRAVLGECAETAARFGAAWIYESPNVFYIQLPDQVTGACPAATRPVWRFLNTYNTNHRYTAEVLVRDDLRLTPGWLAEGYGPDAVIMCAPES